MDNFDKLSFERKVDVLVTQHVFGWDDIIVNHVGVRQEVYRVIYRVVKDTNKYEYVPCYSTLLTSAWYIVRRFGECYLFRNSSLKKGQWECKLHYKEFNPGVGTYYAWAETEMLAICYGGLKAVGFDVREFLKGEGRV